MENRKGSGLFLGIVSVATLIVALIGATFAYFSATTESDPNAVNVTAYEFKLTMDVNQIYPNKDEVAAEKLQLIPMNPATTITSTNPSYSGNNDSNLLYALNEAAEKCIDSHGLQVCALYEVVIYNEAQNQVVLTGQLQTVSNTAATDENGTPIDGREPFTNLTFQALTGKHTDNSLALSGSAVPINDEDGIIDVSNITVSGATTNAETGALELGEGRSYVLVYLNENEDQSEEMGANFTGKLTYVSAADKANQLTAMFNIGA